MTPQERKKFDKNGKRDIDEVINQLEDILSAIGDKNGLKFSRIGMFISSYNENFKGRKDFKKIPDLRIEDKIDELRIAIMNTLDVLKDQEDKGVQYNW